MPESKNKNNDYENDMPLFNRDYDNIDMNTNKSFKGGLLKKNKSEKPEDVKDDQNFSALTIGAFLQEARVKSDYSLSQVAMITKLNIHYIEAIERNDLNNAPPYIYVRAYVKKLSELYGIDQNKALHLLSPYGEHDKIVSESILHELEESKQINEKEEKKIVFMIKIVLTSFIILIIAFVLFFIFSGNSSKKTVSTENVKIDKELLQKNMEKLIVPQTLTPTELKIPDDK